MSTKFSSAAAKGQQQQLKTTSDVTSKFLWCCRASVLCEVEKEALDVASDGPPDEALSCRRRAWDLPYVSLRRLPFCNDGVAKLIQTRAQFCNWSIQGPNFTSTELEAGSLPPETSPSTGPTGRGFSHFSHIQGKHMNRNHAKYGQNEKERESRLFVRP